jgi:hypothetical protein
LLKDVGLSVKNQTEENTTNSNLCACGCNQSITYNKYKPTRFISHHHQKGKNHHNWKGGKKYNDRGYILIWKPDHPYAEKNGYVFEHRSIMEIHLGRYLDPEEVVHHINGIKSDNRLENLMLFESHSKHMAYELTIDMSNRICLLCKSNKTYLNKKDRPIWHRYKDGYICGKCNKKYLLL